MIIGEIKTSGLEVLAALPQIIQDAVKESLVLGGDMIADAIRQQIADSPATGRVYRSRKAGGGLHDASAPGEAIHEDTGETQAELTVDVSELAAGEITVGWAGKRGDQMLALEFGSADGRVAPRPTIVPAAVRAMPQITKMIVSELEAVVP